MAHKIYKKGSYIIIEKDGTAYFEGLARNVMFLKGSTASTSYTVKGMADYPDSVEIPFSDIVDIGGNPYGNQAAFEDWYTSNTGGFSSALGGSSAILGKNKLFFQTDYLSGLNGSDPFAGASVLGGSISFNSAEENHNGLRMLSSAASFDSGYELVTSLSQVIVTGGCRHSSIFQLKTTDALTLTGFMDTDEAVPPVDGIFVKIDGVTAVLGASNNEVSSEVSLGTLSTDTWYEVIVETSEDYTFATATILSNGALVYSQSITNNLPDDNDRVGFGLVTTTKTAVAQDLVLMDYQDVLFTVNR